MIKNRIIKFIAVMVLLSIVFDAGVLYGQKRISLPLAGPVKIINQDSGKPQNLDFSLFWDTWRLVEEKYAGKPDETKMFYGAIGGMVASLGDPYTIFMDPAETKNFADELSGTFDGIGAELGMKKNIITVIAPLPGSPAEKAGLKALDKILKVNDAITADMTIDEAVSAIRGPKGTTVTLTILRGNETETREVKITRDTIVVKSVELKMDASAPQKIAILKVSQFGADTFDNVSVAADEILQQDAKGIVLDMRNNPGGFLESAVNIAGLFLPEGRLVTTQSSNNSKENYTTSGNSKLAKIPIIVLVNGGTASAAEILAGALRDDRQIKLVGEKTFGKGSVQEVEGLKDNSSLKVTVAEWLTPSGKNINKEGLAPDIEVKLTQSDFDANKDPQMDEALKIIRQ